VLGFCFADAVPGCPQCCPGECLLRRRRPRLSPVLRCRELSPPPLSPAVTNAALSGIVSAAAVPGCPQCCAVGSCLRRRCPRLSPMLRCRELSPPPLSPAVPNAALSGIVSAAAVPGCPQCCAVGNCLRRRCPWLSPVLRDGFPMGFLSVSYGFLCVSCAFPMGSLFGVHAPVS
jgi:hypothetical protein